MIKFKEFQKKPPAENIMVVDAMNLAFRWKHMGKLDFEFDYIRTVDSLAKSYKSGSVIITADKGHSSYRKELYPEYKQNRKDKSNASSEKEREEFRKFFQEYEEVLKRLEEKYLLLRYSGVEADDLAAYIVNKCQDRNIWLISSDRDWDLLINDKVSRFSTVTRKETTTLNWDEHYDVEPEDYISLKCLTGDTGDNIPGIPGVGPVKAKQLIDTYGTAFDVYAACPIESKYKYIESLNEHCDRILLNYELMDLVTYCDKAIGEENLVELKNSLETYLNEA